MKEIPPKAQKTRLDVEMVRRGLVSSRSQAENFVKLGEVLVHGVVATKAGMQVHDSDDIKMRLEEKYVSRAGLKLASVAGALNVDFAGATVLDVGSSTGGFTDYALKHGAKKVIAVDVGTEQMHPSLRSDPRIELHEKTDIRDVVPKTAGARATGHERRKEAVVAVATPDIIVIDVSFISLRVILPHIATLMSKQSVCLAMVKPQFEASRAQLTKSGIVKNETVRRALLRDFENWVKRDFFIVQKADSDVSGAHGNKERFYLLRVL